LNNVENIHAHALARAIIFFWSITITAAGIAALAAFVLSTKPPVGLLVVVAAIAAMFCLVALVRRPITEKVQYD
jgi:hypothetical protein